MMNKFISLLGFMFICFILYGCNAKDGESDNLFKSTLVAPKKFAYMKVMTHSDDSFKRKTFFLEVYDCPRQRYEMHSVYGPEKVIDIQTNLNVSYLGELYDTNLTYKGIEKYNNKDCYVFEKTYGLEFNRYYFDVDKKNIVASEGGYISSPISTKFEYFPVQLTEKQWGKAFSDTNCWIGNMPEFKNYSSYIKVSDGDSKIRDKSGFIAINKGLNDGDINSALRKLYLLKQELESSSDKYTANEKANLLPLIDNLINDVEEERIDLAKAKLGAMFRKQEFLKESPNSHKMKRLKKALKYPDEYYRKYIDKIPEKLN